MATLNDILNTLPSNGNGVITAAILRQAFEDVWQKSVSEGSIAGNITTFTVDSDGISVIQDSGVALSTVTSDITALQADASINAADISALTTAVSGKQDELPPSSPGALINDGAGTLSWEETGVGISSARPATPTYIGQMFFDTTLGGKPIWWRGDDWVDSNGTSV